MPAPRRSYCAMSHLLERAAAKVPAPITGIYINPVLDADFPDPVVILAPDGFYYAYATQTLSDGEWINIQVARSARPRPLAASRRRASGEAKLGTQRRRISGRPMWSRMATAT